MTTSEQAFLERVRRQAKSEIDEEDFKEAVKRCKVRLREQKWWHKFVPWKIVMVRRNNV